jgi:hypothetical protein
MSKKFSFEKFMNDILKRESVDEKPVGVDRDKDTSAREYRKKYSELWQNRIKYKRPKNG